ncbi:hypothetical protein JOD57_001484 [Geodermatophilus bullaregiensis]|uniref:hypothetical protein n=1 Tax=Geodermatophilus bullaregiensis TaxID=1564160 RepID=UPI00195993DC|nr:hypothetical protein [Geodermatophilus bullaregiensis]MBM7805647.1 hypothetical protein [Geodermatophilus bullaregiensis]
MTSGTTPGTPQGPPLWRQAFDAAERRVTPHADSLVRTPGFATGVALLRRAQNLARDSARGVSARAWHLVNLPAGSDLARLRAQIGALDREVRRLTVQLENERRRPRAADATTPEEPDADGAQPASSPRPRPARRRAQRPPGA